ncbi:hypothetical protein AT270_27245 [Bacillus cereus]|nr:hypothetical protein AT270_27245 [Bacillus cereus]
MKIHTKKYHIKPFPHFDQRIPVTKNVKENLSSPSYIASHSFYPFIHYTKTTYKYSKDKKLSSPKNREIFYAGHMDGYIYKYYGEKLNSKYNDSCKEKHIDHVSLAYRSNKNGKSNIHFASEVIQFISEQKKAFIFVSDFSSYFDNLDHILLKEKLTTVLGLDSKKLPADWWNIFKNITRYSWVEREELYKDLEKVKGIKIKDKYRERYYTPSEFREFRRRVHIKRNDTGVGIPQGTAISAVLANVYAIDLDYELNKYASKHGGIYRRYSDDIIIVIPTEQDNEHDLSIHTSFINKIVTENKVQMGEGKTKSLYYANQKIYADCNHQQESRMDYLGFSFDGTTVRIREKSLFKYYHRMYKKVTSIKIAENQNKENRKIGRKKLYSIYSHLGRRYKGYGNFISYAEKAHEVFAKNNKIESLIYQQIKRHWRKIHKRLNKIENES